MGTSIAGSSGDNTQQMLEAYTALLPGLMKSTNSQQVPTAQAQLAATQATQPGYDALNLAETQKYALPLAKVGQDVTRSNALAGASTNLAQMQGAGGQLAREALSLSKETNPYYYQVMDAAAPQAAALANSVNLQGLSAGEQNAVERGLNRSAGGTGNLGLSNATNAVNNAMNFGGAFNSKLGVLGNALGSSMGVANTAQNTGFSPVNLALGQPNTSTMGNFGTGTFSNSNAGTQAANSSNVLNFGQGVLGNINQNQMNTSNNAVTLAGQNKDMASSMFGSVMGAL